MCVRQEVHVYETWFLTDQEAHVWLGWLAGQCPARIHPSLLDNAGATDTPQAFFM